MNTALLSKTVLQERLCCGWVLCSELTQSLRLQKKNAPKCYLLTEESSVTAAQQGNTSPQLPFKSEGDGEGC